MLAPSPFLQLIPGRASQALSRLQALIWTALPIRVRVEQSQPGKELVPFQAARRLRFTVIRRTPYFWGHSFDTCWWRLELSAPVTTDEVFLQWHDQGEATVFLDEVPHYGFDPGHKHCPLPVGTRRLHIQSICCRTGIWVTGETQGIDKAGSRFEGASLWRRDPAAWEAYHDLAVLLATLKVEYTIYHPVPAEEAARSYGYKLPVERVSPLYRELLRRIDQAIDRFDAEGLPALRRELKRIYREFPAEPRMMAATLTGHAHMDLVWLWPERIGEFKAAHAFANVLRLMERYPEFRFGYSQPASYQAIGRRWPALLQEVREKIRRKRWDATGAMYVESDTQLPCGEALARSFILGQNRFRELRGSTSRVLWIPDVFGYSPALPQLIKQSGAEYFFTTKLAWSVLTRFPYSSFRWQGHDGSEVIAHVGFHKDYNGYAEPGEIREAALLHRQADVHPDVLVCTGYGDGGGGPTAEMCERVRRMQNLATLPRTDWGRIEPFFDRLAERRDALPVYRGEIFLQYHRGVQTTHGHLKAAFRRCERALQVWEAVRCATGAEPIDERPWERLVFAQFHDLIPGSSIWEVYDEHVPELERIADTALETATAELAQATASQRVPALFNPLPHARVVAHGRGRKRRLYHLPPLAGAPLTDLEVVTPAQEVEVTATSLRNGRVEVQFDAAGRISRMVTDGVVMPQRGPLAELHVFPDHPEKYPAWELDRGTLGNSQRAADTAVRTGHRRDGCSGHVSFRRQLTRDSSAVIHYSLDAGALALQVEYEIEWADPSTLLKVAFPTDFQGRFARYGSAFGSVLRSQHPGEARDEAQWEVPGSRYAMVCDEAEGDGLFLVTEAKYGFGCQSGLLHLSLLRSARVTRTNEGPITPTTDQAERAFSDLGRHCIRLAIGRYRADAPRSEQPAALADMLYTAPVAYAGGHITTPFRGLIGGDSLLLTWAKPCGEGVWLLRANEVLGRRGCARLELAPDFELHQVQLNEAAPGTPLSDGVVNFAPYQLLSLQVRPRQKPNGRDQSNYGSRSRTARR